MAESAPGGSSASNLFQVYLRLRPLPGLISSNDRFITVEPPTTDAPSTAPTHITLNPPNDRRRAIEKFAFTQIFEEDASQLDVFHCTNILSLVESILAPHGGPGTDALLATLGVTGSGKSYTILGSPSQRGLTQLALDLLFRSLGDNIADVDSNSTLEPSVKASDVSEASISTAPAFIEAVYGDHAAQLRSPSRSQMSQTVRCRKLSSPLLTPSSCSLHPRVREFDYNLQGGLSTPKSVRMVRKEDYIASSPLTPDRLPQHMPASARGNAYLYATGRQPLQARVGNLKTPIYSPSKHYMSVTASARYRKRSTKTPCLQGDQPVPPTPRRHMARPAALPQIPDISTLIVPCDPAAEYVVLVSMYEVYNDRIFDLLTPPVKSAATKESRRRPLLFKSTELSPDRKIVAGLRKILCSSLHQALMVVEAGLHERRVAGTGSNSVSSRSHGFFSIEVKKRRRSSSKRHQHSWSGNALTIVDLAGSERARDAKTAGATLAEAGKINESLMYLGQCLQMQSDLGGNTKPSIVPFRQCKLTELLFSNSFPSSSLSQSQSARRNPQKAVMIVTADAHGDYNATSQILRYSALAREIAVPRVPSITETILQANAAPAHGPGPGSCGSLGPVLSLTHVDHRPPFLPLGNMMQSQKVQRSFSPTSTASSEDRVTMERAALEIARLAEENRYLRNALTREQDDRFTAEARLRSMEDRMLDLEQAIREDCVAEFEQRLDVELARWKAGMQVAIERGEEHWDRKMDVFERSLASRTATIGPCSSGDGAEDKENVLVESYDQENERLRREISILKRELVGRSPSKRTPLIDREDLLASANGSPRSARSRQVSRIAHEKDASAEKIHRRLEDLTLKVRSGSENSSRACSKSRADDIATPTKRARKLITRKWEGEPGAFEDPF
ncbi:hypothetical protein N0V93_010232 [Gnomoniopsis smithogilvyi]|uniref:Kinesin motor domain-containing protein n=1 Tax=Gnomoniopsis smithogilvyi TaxID=1191159 RepID=A0A9W8YKT8_9PEZI|nr:hypothetical protein N0V93_010232 [Gnomoniopsis smithogilvyi]